MTTAQLRYGAVLLKDPARWGWDHHSSSSPGPFTEPVDDLLALTEPNAAWRAGELRGSYGAPVGLLPQTDTSRLIRRWQKDGVPAVFERAARKATEGKIAAPIAKYLERVRFVPEHDGVEVPDLLALAAWSLTLVAQRDGYELRKCQNCGLPWLASERGRYCRREAPGSKARLSCQELAKARDFRAKRARTKGSTDG